MPDHTLKTARPPLTAEDLELLATPTEELQRRTEVFSFDQDRFKKRIATGEHWQQLLQAHLYFEHVVTQLLSDALANPDAVNVSRMSFSQKLQFISALNLLPPELISSVEFINGLRNKIAHKLDFEIGDKDVRDFTNCVPKRLRDIASQDDDRAPGPLRFNELLRVVLLQIEVLRQQYALNRLTTRKAEIRLRTVLEKTPGVYKNALGGP
jgi:hypothetical protein